MIRGKEGCRSIKHCGLEIIQSVGSSPPPPPPPPDKLTNAVCWSRWRDATLLDCHPPTLQDQSELHQQMETQPRRMWPGASSGCNQVSTQHSQYGLFYLQPHRALPVVKTDWALTGVKWNIILLLFIVAISINHHNNWAFMMRPLAVPNLLTPYGVDLLQIH